MIRLALTFALVLSMGIPTFAAEPSDGTVIKTWENSDGETVTGIITKDLSVVAANMNLESEDEAKGFITSTPDDTIVFTNDDESDISVYSEVSDYFFMQILNSDDQVLSTYRVTLTGEVSSTSRRIKYVMFNRVSGDPCVPISEIDGYTAYVKITHPTEGYLDAYFILDWDGTFLVF